jgi:hypothetical protein
MSNRKSEPELERESEPKTGELSIPIPLFFMSDFDLTGDMKESNGCNGNCTCGGKKV